MVGLLLVLSLYLCVLVCNLSSGNGVCAGRFVSVSVRVVCIVARVCECERVWEWTWTRREIERKGVRARVWERVQVWARGRDDC